MINSLLVAITVHEALFKPNTCHVLMGNRRNVAQFMLEKFYTMYDNMKFLFKDGYTTKAKTYTTLTNGVKILAVSSQGMSLRGMTIDTLKMDNIFNCSEIDQDIFPTMISKNQKYVKVNSI